MLYEGNINYSVSILWWEGRTKFSYLSTYYAIIWYSFICSAYYNVYDYLHAYF